MTDGVLLRLLLALVCVGLANQADQRGNSINAAMWWFVAGTWLFAMVVNLLRNLA